MGVNIVPQSPNSNFTPRSDGAMLRAITKNLRPNHMTSETMSFVQMRPNLRCLGIMSKTMFVQKLKKPNKHY